MTILIIEDEIITATDLKKTLEKKGHEVLPICKTYDEAIGIFSQNTPALLLVDIKLRLSHLDGIQIAERINRNHTLPVIYLTSQTDYETFERAKLTQPAAYLFKPFRQAELVFQIELAYEHFMVNKPTSPDPSTSENVFFPYKGGHRKVSKQLILFIKADGPYVKVYIQNEKIPLLFSMNIGYIAQFFTTPNFYKLSRSYIVNLDQIAGFYADHIHFDNSMETIQIPQAQRQEFLKRVALVKTPKKNSTLSQSDSECGNSSSRP